MLKSKGKVFNEANYSKVGYCLLTTNLGDLYVDYYSKSDGVLFKKIKDERLTEIIVIDIKTWFKQTKVDIYQDKENNTQVYVIDDLEFNCIYLTINYLIVHNLIKANGIAEYSTVEIYDLLLNNYYKSNLNDINYNKSDLFILFNGLFIYFFSKVTSIPSEELSKIANTMEANFYNCFEIGDNSIPFYYLYNETIFYALITFITHYKDYSRIKAYDINMLLDIYSILVDYYDYETRVALLIESDFFYRILSAISGSKLKVKATKSLKERSYNRFEKKIKAKYPDIDKWLEEKEKTIHG